MKPAQMQCPSIRVIPWPDPGKVAVLENIKQNSSPFLRAAGIAMGSKEHKELKKTIQVLHRQYLHPFKHLEEQVPEHVDQLIAKARISLPWLDKYEDGWPARVYLKRYVNTKRPHLMYSRHALRQAKVQKYNHSHITSARNPEDSGDILKDHNSTLKGFLGSLAPSLEHHFDAFVELGIKDQETLQAFLSWPQDIQTQFLDEGHGVLQLTSLERKGLLVGCGLLTHRALQMFHTCNDFYVR